MNSRFYCSVLPTSAWDLARFDAQRHIWQGMHAAERLADFDHLDAILRDCRGCAINETHGCIGSFGSHYFDRWKLPARAVRRGSGPSVFLS